MVNWHDAATDKLCEAFLTLKSRDECYAFLDDLCTIKEIQDIAQRFSVATLLSEKDSYNAISQKTGASTATISRVSKCYEYGAGGYKNVIEKMNGDRK